MNRMLFPPWLAIVVVTFSGCSNDHTAIDNDVNNSKTLFAGSEEPNEDNDLAVYSNLNTAVISESAENLPENILITLNDDNVTIDIYFHGRPANHLLSTIDDHHANVTVPAVLKNSQLKVIAATEEKIDIDVFDIENLSFTGLQKAEALKGIGQQTRSTRDRASALPSIQPTAPSGIDPGKGIPL